MAQTWKENGPIVIGGIGGSGTRLVADICRTTGIFLGQDLNRALDNLYFTLLFRRYRWYEKNRHNPAAIKRGLRLLKKMILQDRRLSLPESIFLGNAVLDYFLHYRKVERTWSFDRLRRYFSSERPQDNYQAWGWKEPNTYLILPELAEVFPNLKFIHTIRHGLDMAFSSNQRQMKNWGNLFFDDQSPSSDNSPAQSLKFWIAANQLAAEQGKRLGPERYLRVSFDKLCTEPEPILREILEFLGREVDPGTFTELLGLPHAPESLGRYQSHDLSIFNKEDLDRVRMLGFRVDL
ncbi:MAG: sulfotransferase family protein [Anaerolineales bacterium]